MAGSRRLAQRPAGGGVGLADLDRRLQAWRARLTGGVSPVALSLAYMDWLAHLAGMPGREAELAAARLARRDAAGRLRGPGRGARVPPPAG